MAAKPKLAFNLVEHVGGQRSNDAVVAALLEAEGIPFTGASASSLMSCRNKYLSKLIVNGAGVAVPKSFILNDGIHYRLPTRLVASLNGNLEHMARKAYRALQIESYAKLEFRIRANEIVFIEANPNSNLSKLAKSTAFRSIGYEKFIRKVIRMAFNRHARRIASS